MFLKAFFTISVLLLCIVSLLGCVANTGGVAAPVIEESINIPMPESPPPPSPEAVPPPPPPAPQPIQEPESREVRPSAAAEERVEEPIHELPANRRRAPVQRQQERHAQANTANEQYPNPTNSARGFIPGSAAYHIPLSMIENQSSPVDLWIDAGMTVDELSVKLKDFLIENVNRAAKRMGQPQVKSKVISTTQIEGRKVDIGKKMYAELTGPDFEIQPSGLQEQTYIENRSMRWSWLVKPKHESKNGIPLEIRVLADPGEGQTPVETIREVVLVRARARTFREIVEELDWWIKLLGGGGIGAVVVWSFNRLFRRKK